MQVCALQKRPEPQLLDSRSATGCIDRRLRPGPELGADGALAKRIEMTVACQVWRTARHLRFGHLESEDSVLLNAAAAILGLVPRNRARSPPRSSTCPVRGAERQNRFARVYSSFFGVLPSLPVYRFRENDRTSTTNCKDDTVRT